MNPAPTVGVGSAVASGTNVDMPYIAEGLRPLAVAIDQLAQLEGNPRVGDVPAIARSMAVFGQRKPIVVRDKGDGTLEIEAGNHQAQAATMLRGFAGRLFEARSTKDKKRYDAALADFTESFGQMAADQLAGWVDEAIKEGEGSLPFARLAAVRCDDDRTMALAFAMADNRTAALGTEDPAALIDILTVLHDEDGLLGVTGYDEDDLDDLAKLLGNEGGFGRDGDYGTAIEGLLTPGDRRAAYDAAGVRSLVMSFGLAQYAWVTRKMADLRREKGLESNSDLLLAFVSEAVGEEPPKLDEDDVSESSESEDVA